MKKLITLGMLAFLLVSCHENLEERAQRECKEFTEKFCPTPVKDNTRTDSMVFDKTSRTVYYYCTLSGPADNAKVLKDNELKLRETLRQAVAAEPQTKVYKDAGFNFGYVYTSASNPQKVLFKAVFTPKDYQD